MKVLEITVSKTMKIPVPGVPYSNQETSCSMTASVEENEDYKKVFNEAWEEIKTQVTNGMDADAPAWLKQNAPTI